MKKSLKTLALTCMLIPSVSAIRFNTTPFYNYLEKNQSDIVEFTKAAAAVGGAGLLVEYAIKKVGYDTTYSYLGLALMKATSFFVGKK